jgi:hypothetical protein
MSVYVSASKGKMNMFQRYKGENSLVLRCPEKMNLLNHTQAQDWIIITP